MGKSNFFNGYQIIMLVFCETVTQRVMVSDPELESVCFKTPFSDQPGFGT